tara:strand:- start:1709 stop:1897 length:189 start_codon:yes stop_codon:yes gene_type:complete
MNTQRINPQELSSRKLWQLADMPSRDAISAAELNEIIAELAKRCHDLNKLQELDQLKHSHRG